MFIIHEPQLATLSQEPSWTNRAGNVDRAACVEVRQIEVWRAARMQPARTGNGRISTGIVSLTADWLLRLHNRRMPRALSGDFRTAQANAMRPPTMEPQGYVRRGLTPGLPSPYADFGLHGNPNRGVTRTKMLGIRQDWAHPLRVELWQLSPPLRKPFLICPHPRNCACGPDGRPNERNPRLPGLSTIRRGFKCNMDICPQRVLKLFMVLCTEAELADSLIARSWIDSLPLRMRRKQHPTIARLVERYGMLFHPRRLLCQRCLGVKYNESPETIRRLRMRTARDD